MQYRHNITFKLISIFLVTLHLCVFSLRDAAIVFAEDAASAAPAEASAQSDLRSNRNSKSNGNSKNPVKEDPVEEPAAIESSQMAMMSASGGDQSQSQNSSSSFNTNALQNVNPSLFTGALTYSVPVAVPAGRRGIQPNVALTYSSQSGNGILGMGWSLDLGSIERSTKNGVPKYNLQDTFIFRSGGSTAELVNIGGNEYRAKIEEAFMKFTFNGSNWVVKDKSGITYYFGQATSSQQNSGSDVFRWCLDRVQDKLGNYMTLTYIKADGQIYPDTINYTGFDGSPSLSPTFQVDFDYIDTRSDYFFSYRSNFLIKTNKLLSTITAKQNGSRIRKYVLSYQQSPGTNRMLLSSITQYGLTDSTSLPPIEFTYQEKPFTFSDVISWGNIHDFGSGDSNWKGTRYTSTPHTLVDIFDINRDGLPDRIFRGYNNADYTSLWVQLNNGSSFDNLQAWSDIGAQSGEINRASIRYAYTHCYMNTFDINGDALPDRIHTNYNGYSQWEVEINNGNGFDSSVVWTNIDGFHDPSNYSLIWGFNYSPPVWGTKDLFDINGDGNPDRIIKHTANDRWYVQLNNGNNGFYNSIEWLNVQYDTHVSESYIRTGGDSVYFATFDINGDGLPDHLMNHDSDNNWEVQFNNGSGFEDISLWEDIVGAGGSWKYIYIGNPMYVSIADINADGLPDRVMRNYSDTYGPWEIQLNNGHGFEPIVEWGPIIHGGNSDRAHIRAGSSTTHVDFFDINGDTLPDRIMADLNDTTNHWDVQLNEGPMPDLLERVSNGIGGQAQATYDTYIGYDNADQADKGDLGFPVNVVTQITTSDGRGSTYASNYSYDKGKFDYTEREFRGFGKVTATDADGNYSTNYFHQDEYNKGRPYRQETYDSSGMIQAKSESTWSTQDSVYGGYPDIKFVYLSESDSYTYNSGTATKRVKSEYIYGETTQYGNPTQAIEYGEVDVGIGSDIANDKRTTFIEYTYNTSDWIVSLPARSYSEDINSNKVSEKKFYYDDNLGINDSPSQGLLTKEEAWLYNPLTSNEHLVSSIYAYDSYGNLLSATDVNNHTTTTTYDTTYYIFPLTVTNHLGHTVTSQYYGVNGISLNDGQGFKGLFGQVKSAQDPNGVISYSTYDDLGRLEKVIGPNDSINYPGAVSEYDLDVTDPLTDPLKITKRVKAKDNPASLDYPDYYIGYSFYDGIGRMIEAKSPAEPDPNSGAQRQIISGITEYNARGLVDKKYLPYFVNSSPNFVAPSFSGPYASFQYDSLGRVIQTTNPDLTCSSVSYSDWTVTAIDEEGHYKTYRYDAYQRLIQVDENNDGEVYTTTYVYDTLGNLVEVTDHPGNTTTITYDTFGRKVQMNDPDMGLWRYEYDDVGNLTKQIDAAGQELVFAYDVINRLIQKEIQQSQIVIYEYDDPVKSFSVGRLTKVIYQAGQAEFFYDNLGRETQSIKKVDGIEYQVSRSYDSLDRLVSLTYPDTEVVTYTYNPQGIETVISASGGYVANIDYSATSQISKIEYGNGVVTTYNYDPQNLRLNHLTSEHQGSNIQDLQYSFDNVGNVSSIIDNVNSASQTFGYDHLNRLTSANGTYYGQVDYSYDATGNILTKGALSLNYYNVRPHAVSSYTDSSTGYTVDFTYDANGNMQARTNQQTNEQTNYYYDYESHLTRVEQVYPQGQQIDVTLQFQQGWNFFSLPVIPSSLLISDIFSGFTIGTDYDQISRYDPQTDTFENYVGDSLFDEFDSLEYGKGYCIYVNNPAGISVTATGITPTPQDISLLSGWNLIPYPYLSSSSTRAALGNLEYGVDYDLVLSYNQATGEFIEYPGSLSELEPEKSYYLHCLQDTIWNLESLSRTTNFYYDGDGGRVKRRSEIDQANTTTYIGSFFEKVEYDNSSIPTKVKKHIYAGANRVCVVDDGNLRFYHGDHLGSSNVITDGSGTQIARYEYKPFGSQTYESGAYITDVKYTGKIQDDTGLYYYGARYYDPVIGRFISPDTIVQAPQDPQTLNRYAYCRNNPLKYVDPTGHGFFSKFWKTIVGAVVGAIVGVLTYGAGFSLMAAGFWGGASGGALSGGLEGGWKGALIGGAMGGALGAFGGWGVGEFGKGFGYGMLAAGAGAAYGIGGSEGLQRFGAGLFGGLAGGALGGYVTSTEQWGNWRGGKGFVSNRTAGFNEYEQKIKALYDMTVNKADTTVRVISRPLGKNAAGDPGSLTGPRHNAIISDNLPKGKWEMGSFGEKGLINTTNTVENLSEWGTHITTEKSLALGGRYARSFTVGVNRSGLLQAMEYYDTLIAGQYEYSAGVYNSFNSNYAVNSLIYGGGADYQGNSYRAPGFPDGPE